MILAASHWWNSAPSVAAALGYVWWMRCCLQRAPGAGPARWVLAGVWLLHTLALGSALAQQPLRFGFAPALSVTAWLVLTVYALELRLYPRLQPGWQLGGLGAAAVLLAWLFPGASYPMLRSAWLPLHGALGVASYGLLAAALLHAWLMQRAERTMRLGLPDSHNLPLLALERLTFKLVNVAFVLLTCTLLAGWWFVGQLHPEGWLWSHKTLFTLLSWLLLGALLLGRWRWGWRGRRAAHMLYAAAALLLLGYVGSRFVLEVVLHRSV